MERDVPCPFFWNGNGGMVAKREILFTTKQAVNLREIYALCVMAYACTYLLVEL